MLDETARLRMLADYGVMDTGPDEALDEIVALASAICGTPIALVSLVDDTRQWFKARIGLAAQETPRELAFCAHVIAEENEEIFTVPDARTDARFLANPLVTGDPNIAFYAGAPLVVEGGAKLGTLCVLDRQPRELTALQKQALATLSRVVVRHLQRRREHTETLAAKAQLHAVERKRAEELSALFQQAPVAITVLRGPDHRIELANGEICRIWGRTQAEVLGKPLFEVLPEARDQGREELLRRAFETGVPFVGKELPIKLMRTRGAPLAEVYFNFVYQPIRDAQGAVESILVVASDATDSVRAKEVIEAARESAESERKRLYALFMQTPAVIAVLRGPTHIYDLANPTYKEMVGGREIVGRPIREALPELAGQGIYELLDRVYQTGQEFVGNEVPVQLDKTGVGLTSVVYFNFVYQALRGDDNRIQGVLVFAVDVTDQVRARKEMEDVSQQREVLFDEQRLARDAAENANRTMDQFLATVSHELRTPLNAMLGWTRLLRTGQIAEGQREKALATVERNAQAQLQLVGDLLDVSRIISGKMHIELEPVELVSVLEAALDVVRPAAEAKGVQLTALFDPAAGPVTGDSSRLQQVIWNLLSNAVKFTPKGGSVRIRLGLVESFVEIEVTDSGEGIAADFLPHVFERFRQAEGAMSRAHGGLGLGLAIVKNIVELHGGTIRASSAGSGKGASFAVRLPVSPAAAARMLDEDQRMAELAVPKELEGLRMLIVDDEDDSRELLAMLLEQCGAAVTSATSAAAALEAFVRDRFSVVVSDIAMPGEDGYSLVKQIRALPVSRGGRVPVVALTAYARGEDRTRALRAGFNAHVAKPIEASELLAVIASMVRS